MTPQHLLFIFLWFALVHSQVFQIEQENMATPVTTLYKAGAANARMFIDAEKRFMYYLNAAAGELHRINLTSNQDVLIVGGGAFSSAPNNTAGTSVFINTPMGFAVDTVRNVLYYTQRPFGVLQTERRVCSVDLNTMLVTTLLSYSASAPQNNVHYLSSTVEHPVAVAIDEEDNILYLMEPVKIRQLNFSSGIIQMFTANPPQYSNNCPNGIAPNLCYFSEIGSMSFEKYSKRLYFGANLAHSIRYWNKQTNNMFTLAGTGSFGQSGDNGPATSASLEDPSNVAFDSSTNRIYIGGVNNIRMINMTSGIIRTAVRQVSGYAFVAADPVTSKMYFTSNAGINVVEFKCNAGSFGVFPNCTYCNIGTYTDTLGMLQCMLCPNGTYSSLINANSVNNCTKCIPGTYSTDLGATTNDTCQNCPLGTYSILYGGGSLSSCLPCNAGFYGTKTGATFCDPCPIGTSNSIITIIGTYSIILGATSSTTCIACPPSTFNNQTGLHSLLITKIL